MRNPALETSTCVYTIDAVTVANAATEGLPLVIDGQVLDSLDVATRQEAITDVLPEQPAAAADREQYRKFGLLGGRRRAAAFLLGINIIVNSENIAYWATQAAGLDFPEHQAISVPDKDTLHSVPPIPSNWKSTSEPLPKEKVALSSPTSLSFINTYRQSVASTRVDAKVVQDVLDTVKKVASDPTLHLGGIIVEGSASDETASCGSFGRADPAHQRLAASRKISAVADLQQSAAATGVKLPGITSYSEEVVLSAESIARLQDVARMGRLKDLHAACMVYNSEPNRLPQLVREAFDQYVGNQRSAKFSVLVQKKIKLPTPEPIRSDLVASAPLTTTYIPPPVIAIKQRPPSEQPHGWLPVPAFLPIWRRKWRPARARHRAAR